MNGGKGKRGSGKRKCRYCREVFVPDRRNRRHQKACGKGECRAARKKEAQARWLARPENRDYFRGSQHAERVKQWRKCHPDGGRKPEPKKVTKALQDDSIPEPVDREPLKSSFGLPVLQDVLSPLHPLVVGLISNLFDHTLQDDIAHTTRVLIDRGCKILGPGPGHTVETK